MADVAEDTHWQRRVVGRSLQDAHRRSLDRGARLVRAAANVLERNGGASLTVQEVADEAGQSLRTLYQYFASKDELLLAVHEEAMRTFERLLRGAIADLDDPIERLAGAVIASGRMPALHQRSGVDRGLAQLRLQLAQAEPDALAASQEPITAFFRELVEAASTDIGVDQATYLVLATRSAYNLSTTIGNEYGVELPDVVDLTMYCLGGLGFQRPRSWFEDIDARLALSGGDGRSILRRLVGKL